MVNQRWLGTWLIWPCAGGLQMEIFWRLSRSARRGTKLKLLWTGWNWANMQMSLLPFPQARRNVAWTACSWINYFYQMWFLSVRLLRNNQESRRLPTTKLDMGVSETSGTPKSSILIGYSIINHPFWGTPIFGNTHINFYHSFCCENCNNTSLAPCEVIASVAWNILVDQWDGWTHGMIFVVWSYSADFAGPLIFVGRKSSFLNLIESTVPKTNSKCPWKLAGPQEGN